MDFFGKMRDDFYLCKFGEVLRVILHLILTKWVGEVEQIFDYLV